MVTRPGIAQSKKDLAALVGKTVNQAVKKQLSPADKKRKSNDDDGECFLVQELSKDLEGFNYKDMERLSISVSDHEVSYWTSCWDVVITSEEVDSSVTSSQTITNKTVASNDPFAELPDLFAYNEDDDSCSSCSTSVPTEFDSSLDQCLDVFALADLRP